MTTIYVDIFTSFTSTTTTCTKREIEHGLPWIEDIWERSRGAPNSLKKIIIDFITKKLDKYIKMLTIKKSTAEEKDKPELVEKILNIGKSECL